MAFSTQKEFFHIPFMKNNIEFECPKECVKLKSYESTVDDRSWALNDSEQSRYLSDLVNCRTPRISLEENSGDIEDNHVDSTGRKSGNVPSSGQRGNDKREEFREYGPGRAGKYEMTSDRNRDEDGKMRKRKSSQSSDSKRSEKGLRQGRSDDYDQEDGNRQKARKLEDKGSAFEDVNEDDDDVDGQRGKSRKRADRGTPKAGDTWNGVDERRSGENDKIVRKRDADQSGKRGGENDGVGRSRKRDSDRTSSEMLGPGVERGALPFGHGGERGPDGTFSGSSGEYDEVDSRGYKAVTIKDSGIGGKGKIKIEGKSVDSSGTGSEYSEKDEQRSADKQRGDPRSFADIHRGAPSGGAGKQISGPDDAADMQRSGPDDAADKQKSGLGGAADKQRSGLSGAEDKQSSGPGSAFDKQKGGPSGAVDKQRSGMGGAVNKQRSGPSGAVDNQKGGPGGAAYMQRSGPSGAANKQSSGHGGAVDKQKGGPSGAADKQRGGLGGAADKQKSELSGAIDKQKGGPGGAVYMQRSGLGGADDKRSSGPGIAVDKQKGGPGGAVDKQRGGLGGAADKQRSGPSEAIDKQNGGPGEAAYMERSGPGGAADKQSSGLGGADENQKSGPGGVIDKPSSGRGGAADKQRDGPGTALDGNNFYAPDETYINKGASKSGVHSGVDSLNGFDDSDNKNGKNSAGTYGAGGKHLGKGSVKSGERSGASDTEDYVKGRTDTDNVGAYESNGTFLGRNKIKTEEKYEKGRKSPKGTDVKYERKEANGKSQETGAPRNRGASDSRGRRPEDVAQIIAPDGFYIGTTDSQVDERLLGLGKDGPKSGRQIPSSFRVTFPGEMGLESDGNLINVANTAIARLEDMLSQKSNLEKMLYDARILLTETTLERDDLRDRLKGFKEMEKKIDELKRKADDDGRDFEGMKDCLRDQTRYIQDMEQEFLKTEDYYEQKIQNVEKSKQNAERMVCCLKVELQKACLEGTMVEPLKKQNTDMSQQIIRLKGALNEYDFLYKQLLKKVAVFKNHGYTFNENGAKDVCACSNSYISGRSDTTEF